MGSKTLNVLFILFLAPITGEVFATSTPIIAFANPIVLIILTLLYGFGALIIRELLVKWNHTPFTWRSLVIMGAVYGIVEEGLFLWSFFNPNWSALGALSNYDHLLGVNIIWIVHVTMYHVLYSIGIPLLLSYLIFPENNHTSIVGNRLLKVIVTLFFLNSILWMMNVYSEYNFLPGVLQYVFFIGVAILLLQIAKRDDSQSSPIYYSTSKRKRRIFIYGFLVQLVQFVIVWSGPENFLMVVTLLLYVLWLLLVLVIVSKEDMYCASNILAFVAGLISLELFVVLVVDLLSFLFTLPLSIALLWTAQRKITSMNSSTEYEK